MGEQPEVAPIREGDELDWPRLETWLRAHVPDLRQALREPQRTNAMTEGGGKRRRHAQNCL